MVNKTMRPVGELRKIKSGIRFVLTDIDDTLTDEGKLRAPVYSALWELYKQGFIIIPVTGRPAGWCDMIIRQWPVHAVVGENGAFVYYPSEKGGGGRIETLLHPEISGDNPREKLALLREKILEQVPGARIARDQPSRQFDLAIDYREDPPDLGFQTAERIKDLCETEGAMAKISSIHVNAWYGNYDKLSMTRHFLRRHYNMSDDDMLAEVLFCGDSPNDQAMFRHFPASCGVANIMTMLDHIAYPPAFITESPGGAGFVELAEVLLRG